MEKRGKRSVDKKKERAKEEQAKTGQAKKEAVKKEEAKKEQSPKEQSLKEQRKKEDRMSEDGDGKQGLKARLLMCLLYLAVLSTATYAWFTMNNKPKVLNLGLSAAAAGDLLIADDLGAGPGEYDEELDLKTATQKFPMEDVLLNPVTTADGQTFYAPVYTGKAVTDVKEITDLDELNQQYVYEKTFYLKAGSLKNSKGDRVAKGAMKTYEIMLLGPEQDGEEVSGCSIRQSDKAVSTVPGDTAANSIRVSFEVEGQDIVIWEPNSDKHNSDTEKAIDNVRGTYGTYKTLQQTSDGSFVGGEDGNSEKLFEIEEEQDVKVTMRVWMEGTDEDCTNSNELDELIGNIQFISSEVKGGR